MAKNFWKLKQSVKSYLKDRSVSVFVGRPSYGLLTSTNIFFFREITFLEITINYLLLPISN